MLPFRRIERSTVLLIGLVMLSFLIATFDVRAQGEGLGGVLRSGAQSLFAPVQQLATAVTRPVVGFVDGVSNIAGLRDELEAARAENDILRQQLLDVQSTENRLTELERILDLTPPVDAATVTARITSLAPSEFDQIRWIDRGSDDGIALGQAVIDEDGLVGRIDFVAAGSARVRLVTDPRSGVGVRDLSTNETGWVEGRGAGLLELNMFSTTRPVEAGDRLVTDGTRFPPGIPVGVVAKDAEAVAGFTLITTSSRRSSWPSSTTSRWWWAGRRSTGSSTRRPARSSSSRRSGPGRVNARPVALSILLVLVAVVIQTTLFGPGRIQPFGAAPMLVLAVVIACARYLDSEPALLLGFTAGLLLDLLGGSRAGPVGDGVRRGHLRRPPAPPPGGRGGVPMVALGDLPPRPARPGFVPGGEYPLRAAAPHHLGSREATRPSRHLHRRRRRRRLPGGDPAVARPLGEDVGAMSAGARITVLGMVFLALFGVLTLRLWTVQVTATTEYQTLAESNQVRVVETPAPRGEIRDRNGELIAGTRSALAAVLDGALVPDEDDPGEPDFIQRLSTLSGIPVDEVREAVAMARAAPTGSP